MRLFLVLATLWSVFVYANTQSLTPTELIRFRREISRIAPSFPALRDDQINWIAHIQKSQRIDQNLAGFLVNFIGTSTDLTSYFAELAAARELVISGQSERLIGKWLSDEKLAPLAQAYRQLLVDEWKFKIVNEPITASNGKPVGGITRPDVKEITISLTLNDESPLLIFSEEVFHAVDIQQYKKYKDVVDKWIRLVIAENNTPGIDRVSQAERYHYAYLYALEQRANSEVAERDVAQVLQFLLEQSAYYRKLEVYESTRARGPGFSSAMWEAARSSRDPFQTLNIVLSETRFAHLPLGLTSRIGTTTLEQIIVSGGGRANESNVPGLVLESFPTPQLPWHSEEEFLAIVPESIKALSRNVRSWRDQIWQDFRWKQFAESMTSQDASVLGQYLLTSELRSHPYQAEEILRKRFGSHPQFEVYSQFSFIIRVLAAYDSKHRTHFTEDYSYKMLEHLNRDRGMQDYGGLFSLAMTRFGLPGADAKVALAFLRSVRLSRCAGGFLFDANVHHRWREVLELAASARSHAPLLTPKEVSDLLLASTHHLESNAQTDRSSGLGGQALSLGLSQAIFGIGAKYFRDVGEEVFATEFARYERRTRERLDQRLELGRQEFGQRSPTPSSYRGTQIPKDAARMIIAAIEAREQFEMLPAHEVDGARRRIWDAVTGFCNSLLFKKKKKKAP